MFNLYPIIHAGILVVPVGDLPSEGRVSLEKGAHVQLGAAGYPGYNIVFSTQKSFSDVLNGFKDKDLLNPRSIVDCSDGQWDGQRLEDLLPDTIDRLSQDDDLFITLEQDIQSPQTIDMAKISNWWYEKHNPFFSTSMFAVNLGEYDERILEVAYQFTNYDVNEEDKSRLRSMMESILQE